MSRIAYVNGCYTPHAEAAVHIDDRGYQFADGVYEVIAVSGGRLVDGEPHLDRLDRSLGELRIPWPMGRRALGAVMNEVLRRNRVRDGMIYLQVTRGVARRDHFFPHPQTESSLVITAKRVPSYSGLAEKGIAVISLPDNRWGRCDIKTTALLPNILAKQRAKEEGAYEALLVDREGLVTEGAAANAWIVTASGELRTRRSSNEILTGITRLALRNLAEGEGLTVVEKPFTVAEAQKAQEVFITSSTAMVLPVVEIDGMKIGDGRPGPVVTKLRTIYIKAAKAGGAAA